MAVVYMISSNIFAHYMPMFEFNFYAIILSIQSLGLVGWVSCDEYRKIARKILDVDVFQ